MAGGSTYEEFVLFKEVYVFRGPPTSLFLSLSLLRLCKTSTERFLGRRGDSSSLPLPSRHTLLSQDVASPVVERKSEESSSSARRPHVPLIASSSSSLSFSPCFFLLFLHSFCPRFSLRHCCTRSSLSLCLTRWIFPLFFLPFSLSFSVSSFLRLERNREELIVETFMKSDRRENFQRESKEQRERATEDTKPRKKG